MKTVSIHDAKTNLSKYIATAKRGEKVFIGLRGEPEVELVYRKPPVEKYRKLGVAKSKIWEAQGKLRLPDNLEQLTASQGFRMLDLTAQHLNFQTVDHQVVALKNSVNWIIDGK